MTSQNAIRPSTAGRKVRRLGIGIGVVFALYSAGWFYGASRLDSFLAETLAGQAPGNVKAECDNLSVGGFPFLIGVTCDKARLADTGSGLDATFGAFRSAARIYMPGTAVLEFDGPARLNASDPGLMINSNWQSLRASFSAGFDGVKRASLEGRDIASTLTSGLSYDVWKLAIAHPELHVRNNDGDLDVALLAEKLDLGIEGQPPLLPQLSASADLTLVDKGHVLAGQPYGAKAMKGELRSFKADLGNGIYGELSGPFSISEDGWLSGDLTLTLENLDLWEQTLARAFPDTAVAISSMAEVLRGLTKDKMKVTVRLAVVEGAITLSMIPIGHIPQL